MAYFPLRNNRSSRHTKEKTINSSVINELVKIEMSYFTRTQQPCCLTLSFTGHHEQHYQWQNTICHLIWYPYHSCYTFQASYQHNLIALHTKKQSFFWHTCIHLLIVICLFCLCLSTAVITPNFLTNWHVDLNPSHFPPHHGHSCLSLLYVSW